MFITLPKVFDSMGMGTFVGIMFFVLVLFAAMTSSIALTESAVSTFEDELGWGRKKSTVIMGVIMLALGTLSSLGYGPLGAVKIIGMQFLDFFDFLTNSVMMPIAAITICLLVFPRHRSKGCGRRSHARRSRFPPQKDIQFHDQVSLPGICCDYFIKLRGKCIWTYFYVRCQGHKQEPHAVLAQTWGSCFMTRSDIRIKGKRQLHDMRIPAGL